MSAVAETTDHDQLMKTALRVFFADFLTLFVPGHAAKFDLSAVTWLDKEFFAAPPDGPRHVLDMVAELSRLGAGGETVLALVHVEIESKDSVTDIERRLPAYYFHLRRTHEKPVLPVVLFLKVGLDGLGVKEIVEDFEGEPVQTTRYRYIGLPALPAVDYLHGGSWLGVALSALMRAPKDQRVALGVEAMGRIAASPLSDNLKSLLGDCVETYIDLPKDEVARFHGILEANATGRVPIVNKTRVQLAEERATERGLAQGMAQGVAQGVAQGELRARRAMVTELLEARFGAVPADISGRLEPLDTAALREILVKVGTAESLDAFRAAVGW